MLRSKQSTLKRQKQFQNITMLTWSTMVNSQELQTKFLIKEKQKGSQLKSPSDIFRHLLVKKLLLNW